MRHLKSIDNLWRYSVVVLTFPPLFLRYLAVCWLCSIVMII